MAEPDLSPDLQSLPFAEDLYSRFLQDPATVPGSWRKYFERLDDGDGFAADPRTGPSFRPPSVFAGRGGGPARPGSRVAARQERLDMLVRSYRVRGHLVARLDPLGRPREDQVELHPEFYGFTDADLDRRFSTNAIAGIESLTLREILAILRDTYCRSIGVQFMHMDSLPAKNWLTYRMESSRNRLALTRDEQIRILRRLTEAVIFEEFLQKKYQGAKSFSLEGAETLIPLLDLAIERAGAQGIEEIVLGMAHRGRLNVLRNIMRKGPREIFREFEDPDPLLNLGRGDVKYHLGRTTFWKTVEGRKVHITLCFNPSHLEFVNPVVLGRTRAKQDRIADAERERGLALIIHGDAAFAGEGVVQETLNLSQLDGYFTGGAIHVILNNQLGFTTPPEEARSTTYATDVAKMLQSPIFHVNGEDPEAVAQVVNLALEFRKAYRRDVVIDMYAFRRRGHNEGDEPAFTQPLMYRAIRERRSTRREYLDHLLKLGEVTSEEADALVQKFKRRLEREFRMARSDAYVAPSRRRSTRIWKPYRGGSELGVEEPTTAVDAVRLSGLLARLTELPGDVSPHRTIGRLLRNRRAMADGERPLDWAAGEALALATLATEGHRIRMTGQDSLRGTFSHRHASVVDSEDGRRYIPLQHLSPDQAPVEIVNSPLSEAAVLGFEWGYSLEWPDALVLWEAQFGDFVNAAQVIVDQFIVSAEDKWKLLSGLTLLLPHGFEGMGPEHSSARLERFLSLAAEENLQIVNLTTPAQYFHALRRQVTRPWRKPLVVMSPKSLLRHPLAVSSLADLSEGRFHRILPDAAGAHDGVTRILLASGKICYDLERWREERSRTDVAILRLEQLYPLPERILREALEPYPAETPVFFVQEEPENMGAWRYLHHRLRTRILDRHPFSGIYREESASPATGSAASHEREQELILMEAFRDDS